MADVWQTIEAASNINANTRSVPPVTGGLIGAYPATATGPVILQFFSVFIFLGLAYKSTLANVFRRINADANPDKKAPNREWIGLMWNNMGGRLLFLQGTAFIITLAFTFQVTGNSFLYLRNYESIVVHMINTESSNVIAQINIAVALAGILLTALWYQSLSVTASNKLVKTGLVLPHVLLLALGVALSSVLASRIDAALLPTKFLITAAVLCAAGAALGIVVFIMSLINPSNDNNKNITGRHSSYGILDNRD